MAATATTIGSSPIAVKQVFALVAIFAIRALISLLKEFQVSTTLEKLCR